MRRFLPRRLAELNRGIVAAASPWTELPEVALSGTSVVLADDAFPDDVMEIQVVSEDAQSNTGNQPPSLRVGPAAGVVSSGYAGSAGSISGTTAGENAFTAEVPLVRSGIYTANLDVNVVLNLHRWDPSEHLWFFEGIGVEENLTISWLSGEITLAGPIKDMSITTPGGAATLSGDVRARYR